MASEFEIGYDCVKRPVLYRSFEGVNADSMKGREAIAIGEEKIQEVFDAIQLFKLEQRNPGKWKRNPAYEKATPMRLVFARGTIQNLD